MPLLAIRRYERVLGDECVETAALAENYLQMVMAKYSQILLPLTADRNIIRDHWRDIWLNSTAGKGLECLS